MATSVNTNLDMSRSLSALRGPNGPEARAVFTRGKRVEAGAKRRVNVDTGRLRASIHTEMHAISGFMVARVGTDVSYARAVHGGTGIYGPKHMPIRPKNAKVLIWRPRGGSRIIVARQVRGVPANKFLTDALKDV